MLDVSSGSREPACRHVLLHQNELPRWEGLHSWQTVTAACEAVCNRPALTTIEGYEIASGVTSIAVLALEALRRARPIHIGPEQLAATPMFASVEEAFAYGRELRLPFQTTYLDFTGPRGPFLLHADGPDAYELFGAIALQGDMDHPEAIVPAGKLALLPFGAALRTRDGVRAPADGCGGRLPHAAPLGIVVVDVVQPESDLAIAGTGHHLGSPALYSALISVPAHEALTDLGGGDPAPAIPARIVTGTGGLAGEALRAATASGSIWKRFPLEQTPPEVRRRLLIEARVVVRLAVRALTALYLLDSVNVTLTEAPVSRQVRRAVARDADRRKIAKTIAIRTRRRRPHAAASDSDARFPYSHAFERAGGYRHVTRGPHVACRRCHGQKETCTHCGGTGIDPDRVTPCPKPHGRCRREIVPEHVVGADRGLPFVPKTRVLKGAHDVAPQLVPRRAGALSAEARPAARHGSEPDAARR